MKKSLVLFFALLLAPVLAVAQTATPTATHTSTATPVSTPFIVGLSGFNLDSASATRDQQLGIPYSGYQGVFVYAQATETISKGNWVFLNERSELTLTDTTEAGAKPLRVCVAANDMTTTLKYGWVWCGEGNFQAYVAAGIAPQTPLYTTGTAGVLGLGGASVAGCRSISAGSASAPVTVYCGNNPVANIAFPTPSPTPTP